MDVASSTEVVRQPPSTVISREDKRRYNTSVKAAKAAEKSDRIEGKFALHF
jgi:hypothetical protein